MTNRKLFSFLILTVLVWTGPSAARGQNGASARPDTADYPYWIRMMQDPGENFFRTRSAFRKYWQNRPVTRGCGWKVFKRWEYIMSGRIAPDGTMPAPDAVFTAWQTYRQSNRSVSGNWQSIGPSVIPSPGPAGYLGLGRLNVIDFHPSDPNILYAGSPSGGFWRTTDNGATWSTTTDNMPTLGVSAILVDYSNPSHILIGTGDRDHGDAPGMGVFRSLDGGLTWTASKTGMNNTTVCELIQHPGNPLICLAATTSGIYRSVDGGSSWTLTVSGDYKDICFQPGNPMVVFAEWGADFYRSADNGLTFTQITNGIPTGQRGAIAVTPANPQYVYFLQSNNSSGFKGVYRSTDGGLSFTTMSTTPNILDWSCDGSGTGGQGWYDLVIVADPSNAETVFVGGIDVWKSVNGGTTWSISSHWYGGCGVSEVHADCHFLGYSPANGRLYAGNDGGIYFTANGGTTWTDCTPGMTIGQIYKIGQSLTDVNKTINGFQDNGTYTSTAGGWVATGGGDGMECAVDYTNAAYTYHTLYFGSIFRKYNNGSDFQVAGEGVFGIDESGGWVTPFILSESDPKQMFVGYKNVWRSNDVRTGTPVWTKISEGETVECSVLEQSPANHDLLYVVRWNSMVRTENANAAGPTWIACTLPDGLTPSDLEAHPTLPNTVYATAGHAVYVSADKGATWSQVQGALPDVPVNCLVYDKNTDEGLYIGTQTGVLYKDSGMQAWLRFDSGLPAADVRELEIFYDPNPSNRKIFAATYGRGLWRSDLYTAPQLPPVAAFLVSNNGPCTNETVTFTDISQNAPTDWLWSFSPSFVIFQNGTTSASRNPQVRFISTADYTVTLTAGNTYGTGSTDSLIGVGGRPLPFTADFEDGSFPPGTVIQNPDNGITWAVTQAAGNPAGGTKGVWMDFYDYNASGQLDDMILQPVSLVAAPHPWLTFRVAYRRYDAGYYDGLKVFVSTDCGNSWNPAPVYDKSGAALATGPDQSAQFYPAVPSDWRTDSVDLSAWKGQKIRLKFQSVNGYGNNLYLDDITVADAPVLVVGTTTVASGQHPCFDASQTIRVADGSGSFTVNSGGVTNFIAGQNILFFDGTRVFQGGYLRGRIEPGGPYCETAMKEGASGPEAGWQAGAEADERTFRIYPNPNDGRLTVDLTRLRHPGELRLEVIDLLGNRVFERRVSPETRQGLQLDIPAGMYFVRISGAGFGEVVKMVVE